MRRTLAALPAAFALVAVASGPVPAAVDETPVAVAVIDGRGFGHGVGMAQEGAYWMAAAGAATEQILGQFYPGTGLGRARGTVRVPVLDGGPAPAAVAVAFPSGGEVREAAGTGPPAPGFPVRVAPGGEVRIVHDGARTRIEGGSPRADSSASPAAMLPPTPGTPPVRRIAIGPLRLASSTRPQVPTLPPPQSTTSTTGPPPPTFVPATTTTEPPSSTTTTATTTPPPADPPGDGPPAADEGPRPSATAGPSTTRAVVAVPAAGGTVAVPARQRQYRGVMEATAATGTLRLVNAVDVEQYLAGMGEVRDPSWPPAALRAQAIAARTYALRAMTTGGEICDTQRCQVYLGAQAEFAAMSAAVSATREQVLVYQRALISAVYSANGGGHSASREEGFGVTDAGLPYLRPAPYPTKDPGPWTARVALGDIAARLAYPGTLTDVRTTRVGPSGRVLELVLDGTAGRLATTGIAFDAALGLRSTLFTVRVESAAAPPPPPPAEAAVAQAPPEEAAAAAAIETAAAEDDTGAAAGAHRALEPSMEARRSPGRRYAPMILAGWSMLAVTGAAGVATAGVLERNRTRSGSSLTPKRRWRRRPRRVPSPSAPPGGDASG